MKIYLPSIISLFLLFLFPTLIFALSVFNWFQGGTNNTTYPANVLIGTNTNQFIATGTPQLTVGNLIATSTTNDNFFLGKVGVGTSTPWGILSVNPNLISTTIPGFVVGSSTKTNFIVSVSGNVGIGTTNPQYNLDVQTHGDGQTAFAIGGDGASHSMTVDAQNNILKLGDVEGGINGTLFTVDDVNTKFTFIGGNVGIASSTPWKQLSIGSSNIATIAMSTTTAGCLNISNKGELYSATCASGGGISDPFTHPAVGQSATTSLMIFNGNASTTQLSASGYLYASNLTAYHFTRNLGGTVGNTTNIGMFTSLSGNGVHAVNISVSCEIAGLAVTKSYAVTASYDMAGIVASGVFTVARPLSSTGAYAGQDFDLDAADAGDTLTLRLRKSTGSASPTCTIQMNDVGTPSIFTPSSATATGVSVPTSVFPGARPALLGLLDSTTYGTNFGNWNSTGSPVPTWFTTVNNNGGATPSAPEPALLLTRNGVGGVDYGEVAEFNLSRYTNSAQDAKTQLDIALVDGSGIAAGTNIMSWLADGRVGISSSTPSSTLSITGSTSLIPFFISTTTTTSASTTLYMIDKAGTQHYGGGTPAVTCSATCSLDGNSSDQTGTINLSGIQTSVTLTFSVPKSTAPNCWVSDSSTSVTPAVTSRSTSAITIGLSVSIGTGSVSYGCINGPK